MEVKRQYGIDLLRIISMYMIIVLHILMQGGIFGTVKTLSHQFDVAWILEALCICAVNCYALISGYVSVNTEKLRLHKIAALWLQVVFYTVLFTAVFGAIQLGGKGYTYEILKRSIFPVYTNHYWYFSCYFALFFLIPFLNKMLNALNKKELKTLFLIIVILFSTVPTIFREDAFKLSRGYSVIWLVFLYILGGITKKLHTVKLKVLPLLFGYAACSAVAFISLYAITKSGTEKISNQLLYGYSSPTILLAAYFLFLAAININIKFKPAISMIKAFSPLSFSVYIIHTNYWIWNFVMKKRFAEYAQLSPVKLAAAVLLTALAIYIFCSAIDVIRFYIFKAVRLSSWLEKLENKIFKRQNIKDEVKPPEKV